MLPIPIYRSANENSREKIEAEIDREEVRQESDREANEKLS